MAGCVDNQRMPSLADVVDLLHTWYPPGTAVDGDAVGLSRATRRPTSSKVLLAVDPTIEVAREAVEWGADLLVVHHPLFLTPVSSVAATTPKGRTLHALTAGGCALLTAHTNADQAGPGCRSRSRSRWACPTSRRSCPPTPARRRPAPGGSAPSSPPPWARSPRTSPGAPRDRARRAGLRRPRPAGAPGGAVRRRRRLPAGPAGRLRRRRLPDQRPAPPPGRGVPRARRARAGRRRPLGGGVDVAARGGGTAVGRGVGDRLEVRVSTLCTDPWQFRVDQGGTVPQSPTRGER